MTQRTVGGFSFTDWTQRQETANTTPVVSGWSAASPGTLLTVTINSVAYPVTVASDGTWSLTVSPALSPGLYDITVADPNAIPYSEIEAGTAGADPLVWNDGLGGTVTAIWVGPTAVTTTFTQYLSITGGELWWRDNTGTLIPAEWNYR